ncbi:MAG TPA: TrbI/VirB10 family protein, partial [Steroidobacteraceae bacterium]|nr:TrbI/VirB10 family protein [Steroidobacteraceae bacterium]
MVMSRLGAVQRCASRIRAAVWRVRGSTIQEEAGVRSRVPGRHEATEALVGPLHAATLSTPSIVGLSLVAAAVLGWYYAHAYTHAHATGRNAQSHLAEPADSPLPPLQHAEVATRAMGKTEPRDYLIGDILESDDGVGGGVAAHGIPTGKAEPPAYADSSVGMHGPPLQLPQARRLDGAVFTRMMVQPAGAAAIADADGKSPNPSSRLESSSIDRLLRSELAPAIAAAVLPTQRLLLPMGAFIDCTLETAIDSTLPGLTTCITAFDTFSADGTVVLLERGTKLIGEMRSQVQQGTARAFVLWTEARTPKGVVVALASPGTDALGRSGLPGTVDRHFADRFGAAILVSIINGAIQSAVNHSQQNGGTVILNPSGAGDVATEVL